MGLLNKKIILLTLLFISTVLSANIAKVVALKGDATILREGKVYSLTKKSTILKHDEIKTKSKSKVQLLFKDNTVVSIGGNSSFQVFNYFFDEKNKKYEAEFSMLQGTFRTITGKIGKIAPKKFNLKTKSASIGIRGTQIVMNLSKDQEEIFCTEGEILVKKTGTNLSSIVNAGQFVALNSNSVKLEVKKIKKSDIEKINKNVAIKDNIASDNITLQEDSEAKESVVESKEISTEKNKKVVIIESIKPKITEPELTEPDADDIPEDNFSSITPKSYFENNNSTATYKGDFNNYSFSEKDKQYIKDINKDEIAIPTNTSISMDIDFGASKDHISNGEIIVNDGINNETFEFDGEIKNIKKATFELKGIKDITSGHGKGVFYGPEANLIQGEVDFKSKTSDIEIEGKFDAKKP